MKYSEDSPGCGPHGGQENWWAAAKETALNEDSVSDGVESRQGRLWDLIWGQREMGKLLWEMWNVREPGFREQCSYKRWWPPTVSLEQWQNTGPQITQGACSCSSPTWSVWVTWDRPRVGTCLGLSFLELNWLISKAFPVLSLYESTTLCTYMLHDSGEISCTEVKTWVSSVGLRLRGW